MLSTRKIKIGIVEDEAITIEILVRALGKLNYDIAEPASTYQEAIQMLEREMPDLLLIDINLQDDRDGIDLANHIKEHFSIPFIFLTANSDSATIDRAKKSMPLAFLIKPFTQVDLLASIEIALNLHLSQKQAAYTKADFIYLKVGAGHEKFNISEILFFENKGRNYIIHFISGATVSFRSSTEELLEKLPEDSFIQIQRSFIVNIHHVNKIDVSTIYLGKHQLQFKRDLKDELMKKWNPN